jgi:ATP-dependent exoDNAse (exonuclease V) beta subunit
MLWVKSNEPPFEKAGYLPVKYSSKLNETLFGSYYEEEHAKTYLDNLNLLYVALTRAEHGLVVIAPLQKNDNLSLVSDLLFQSMQQAFTTGWDLNNSTWTSGKWTLKEDKEKSEEPVLALTLKNYATALWRDKLVIRQTSKGHFESLPPASQKLKYGIHLHHVLSKIKYQYEIESAIASMLAEGILKKEEVPIISSLVSELLSNAVVANWFSTDWQVLTEVPILIPGEGDNRIDRLLIKDTRAVVIDFKTGEQSKADQKQVAAYIEILYKMNFKQVEGYLLYIKSGEIISVPPGKKSRIKESNEGQLGLGL